LGVFLTGRVPIDNTLLERNFMAVAAGRKNYLFLGKETADPMTAILYTIVRNAAYHSLDIRAYLQDLLVKVPDLVEKKLLWMISCQTAGLWPTRKRPSLTGTSKTLRLTNESKEGPSPPDIQQIFNGHQRFFLRLIAGQY
jgi:hypothetical protein